MTWKEELNLLLSQSTPADVNSVKETITSLVKQFSELDESETKSMMLFCGLKLGVNSLVEIKKRVYDVASNDDADDHTVSILNGLTAKYITPDPKGNLMFFKTSLTSLIKNEERIKPHFVLAQDTPRQVTVKTGQMAVKSIHFWVDGEIRDVTLWGDAIDTYKFTTGTAYKMVTTPAREGGYFIDSTLAPIPVTAAPPDLTTLVDYIVQKIPEAVPPFSVLSNIKSYYIVGQLLDLGGTFVIINNHTKTLAGTLTLFNSQRLPLKSGQKFISVGKFSKKRDSQDDYYFYPDVFIDSKDGMIQGTATNVPRKTAAASNEATDAKNKY